MGNFWILKKCHDLFPRKKKKVEIITDNKKDTDQKSLRDLQTKLNYEENDSLINYIYLIV